MYVEHLSFLTPEEVPVAIEAEFTLKEKGTHRKSAVIILHPHPQMGGNMHFKMLSRLAKSLYFAGFDVLRFNFRGVGKSGGEYGGGILEGYDFMGAYAFLLERSYENIAAVGYSFGSVVGLSQLANLELKSYTAIGFPNKSDVFDEMAANIENVEIPTLFISGENDEFSDLSKVSKNLRFEIAPKVEIIQGENHFFEQKHEELCETVVDFIQKQMVN